MVKKILKENWYYILILVVLIVVFSIIMRSSLHDKIVLFDYKVFDFFKKVQTNELTIFFKIVTNVLAAIIPIILLFISGTNRDVVAPIEIPPRITFLFFLLVK